LNCSSLAIAVKCVEKWPGFYAADDGTR